MPARKGAKADFQVRSMTSAVPYRSARRRLGQRPVLAERQPPARQVGDDALAHAGHVIEQRGAQASCEEVDRPSGQRARRSFTTEWQRTKSPIHMYGTSRIGLLAATGSGFRQMSE